MYEYILSKLTQFFFSKNILYLILYKYSKMYIYSIKFIRCEIV